jgi:hypothetical protein
MHRPGGQIRLKKAVVIICLAIPQDHSSHQLELEVESDREAFKYHK